TEIGSRGEAFTIETHEFCFERRRLSAVLRRERRHKVPVLRAPVCESFTFPVDDEARGSRLDTTCGEFRADFPPEHGRNVVPVETVEDPARFLRVDECLVKLPRV